MDIISVVLIIATMFFFTNTVMDITPLTHKQEKTFYETQNDIKELRKILIKNNISENTDINDKKDKLNQQLSSLNGFKVSLPDKKKEGELTKIKKLSDNLYALPLFRINDKYYNVLVKDEYIIVNELNPIGSFDRTFGDYSQDSRLSLSISIPK